MRHGLSASREFALGLLAAWGVFAIPIGITALLGVFFEHNVVTRALDEVLSTNPLARGAEILALLGVTAASLWALSTIPTGTSGPDGR